MQILRLSIYTGRRRSFVITYLSKKKYCARLCIYTESFICEVLFVYVEILKSKNHRVQRTKSATLTSLSLMKTTL